MAAEATIAGGDARSGPRNRPNWPTALFVGALLLAGANVLLYAARQANPLPMGDEWVYLDSFVRKAAASDLTLFDFFVKRSALDHANPLRRAILLMHYEWFGLDYRVQGMCGVLFAFASLALLWRIAVPEDGEVASSWGFRAAFLSIAAVYLSLNSGTIYTWPLLTLAFSNHFFVFLCILSVWRANIEGTRQAAFALFGTSLALNVVADDTALLASIAILIASATWHLRDGDIRHRLARAAKVVVLPVVVAFAMYKLMFQWVTKGAIIAAPIGDNLDFGEKLHLVFGNLYELLAALHVPLVAALAHKSQLNRMFGSHAILAEWCIFAIALGAHAWFWWRASTRKTGRAGFAALVIMLYFYGALAAILVARVSVYGPLYFWQPRYVFVYQLSVVALLLMAIDSLRATSEPSHGSGRLLRVATVVPLSAIFLIGLQFPLSSRTWHGIRGSTNYQKRLARQIGEIATHPGKIPRKCVPALIICKYPAEQRTELVAFLKDGRLSVFSPSFQARYRLYPGE